jgi:hypothetical protein
MTYRYIDMGDHGAQVVTEEHDLTLCADRPPGELSWHFRDAKQDWELEIWNADWSWFFVGRRYAWPSPVWFGAMMACLAMQAVREDPDSAGHRVP